MFPLRETFSITHMKRILYISISMRMCLAASCKNIEIVQLALYRLKNYNSSHKFGAEKPR